jgi:hypothetical protein
MPTIRVNKNMNEVTYEEWSVISDKVNEIIRQRANPVDDTMDYLKKLFGDRYDDAEWKVIGERVNEIIRQRYDPADKVINYVKALFKGEIHRNELYL